MSSRRAFTLVELAIVLVIIGLLAGSVLIGQTMIRAQSLRNSLQQAKTYAIAVQLFKEKYSSLPGDMLDAERIWGNAENAAAPTVDCVTPTTTVSVGTATCNGNGNGRIESPETFRTWQQLSTAAMITGSYTGVKKPGGSNFYASAENVPTGALANTGFLIQPLGSQIADNGTFFIGEYDNTMMLGAFSSNTSPYKAAFTGSEAYAIDRKVDDGLPAYGSVRTYGYLWSTTNGNGVCASSNSGASAVYDTTSSTPTCMLFFMSTFQAKPQ